MRQPERKHGCEPVARKHSESPTHDQLLMCCSVSARIKTALVSGVLLEMSFGVNPVEALFQETEAFLLC